MTNLIKSASEILKEVITDALGRLVAENVNVKIPLPEFNIEFNSNISFGDFSTNAAMACAKSFRLPPVKVARLITEKVCLDGTHFCKSEIAGPGFMNFFLSQQWFADAVAGVLAAGDDFGKTDFGAGKRVLLEFVSANPTGPMHIGNARGGAIGDTLASVMEWAGFHTEREFYINDAGNQIEKFGKSLSLRYMQVCSPDGQKILSEAENSTAACLTIYGDGSSDKDLGLEETELSYLSAYNHDGIKKFIMPEDSYRGVDIIEYAMNYYNEYGDILINESEEKRKNMLVDFALPKNIEGLERDLRKYRIVYDTWYKESKLHESGKVAEIVDKLKNSGCTYEHDGAIWFKATDFGVEKDFVLVRANGIPTYIVPDIAYHYDKLVVRGFDKAINVLGADHHGYVPRLKAALTALGISGDRLDAILMQMVRLLRNGKEAKLSKRSGKAITLVTLLDDIPVDAARFYFNMREANSQFDFDLDLAVETTSQNPVYYVQYAHARICSLLRRLKEEEGAEPDVNADFTLLTSDPEIELIRHIASLPEIVNKAAKTYDPSRITKYAIELATLFHSFYDNCSIKYAETQDLKIARLTLSLAARQVLRNALSILNINCPERM